MKEIQKVIKLREELNKLRPLKKEDEDRAMEKLVLDWNYHSNKLEGNKLSYGETKALLLHGITAQGKPLKDHFEITGHDEAIKWVLDVIKNKRPLTENFIRELHKLILKEPYEVNAITPHGKPTKKMVKVGEYKTQPNHLKTKTGETFRFATPEETPARMHDLLEWYKKEEEKSEQDPLFIAALFHYKYIRIHPFDDGNGRTARILMNFILMKHGYPPAVITTEEKEDYFSALQIADSGSLEPFISFIATSLSNSLNTILRAAKGETIEEADDLYKEIALLGLKVKGGGKKVEVTKSIEALVNLFEHSIVPLINVFLEKGQKFQDMYLEYGPNLSTNSFGVSNASELSILTLKKNILNKDQGFYLSITYRGLTLFEHHKFNFRAYIEIKYDFAEFTVGTNSNVQFFKPYNEPLTKEEIKKLVDSEMRRHKEAIEEELGK